MRPFLAGRAHESTVKCSFVKDLICGRLCRSKSRKSRGRDHSRAKRSKSSSSPGHSRSRRSRRQGAAGGNKDHFGLSVLPVSQKGAQELPNATMKDDSGDSDVDLSHVDLSKVQEEINFADI
eukprot:symbB.v1.2.019797.t1/scaffold1636.1/size108148/2